MRFKLKVSNSEENRKIRLSGLGFLWPEVDTTAKFLPLVYLDNIWHIYKVEVHTLETLWDINRKPFVPLRKIYMLRQLAKIKTGSSKHVVLGVYQMVWGSSSTYWKMTAIHEILAKLLTVKVDVLLEKIMEKRFLSGTA